MSRTWIDHIKSKFIPQYIPATKHDTDYIQLHTSGDAITTHARVITAIQRITNQSTHVCALFASLIPPKMCENHTTEATNLIGTVIARCTPQMVKYWTRAPVTYAHPLIPHLRKMLDVLCAECTDYTTTYQTHQRIAQAAHIESTEFQPPYPTPGGCWWAITSHVKLHTDRPHSSIKNAKIIKLELACKYIRAIIAALRTCSTSHKIKFPTSFHPNTFTEEYTFTVEDVRTVSDTIASINAIARYADIISSSEVADVTPLHTITEFFSPNTFNVPPYHPWRINRKIIETTPPHTLLSLMYFMSLFASATRVNAHLNQSTATPIKTCDCDDTSRNTYNMIDDMATPVNCPLKDLHHPQDFVTISALVDDNDNELLLPIPKTIIQLLATPYSNTPCIPLREAVATARTIHRTLAKSTQFAMAHSVPRSVVETVAATTRAAFSSVFGFGTRK